MQSTTDSYYQVGLTVTTFFVDQAHSCSCRMIFRLIFSVWLDLYSVTIISYCVTSQRYIVASPESHCPTEFMGEPCLTLRQYASNPSQSSYITLILEPGDHYLTEPISRSGSNSIISFVMTAEHANIIHMSQNSYHFDISVSQFVQISGVTFIGNFTHIAVSRAQEVIVSECNFQGVSLSLRNVTNATISRCNFSNYHQDSYYYYTSAALRVSDLNTVVVVQCNFSNNERAIAVYRHVYLSRNTYIVNSTWSLNIWSCTFINTWGSNAVYFSMTLYIAAYSYYYTYPRYRNYMISQYYGYANLDIMNSTFINNTSKYYGSAVCYKITFDGFDDNNIMWLQYYYHARLNITYSTFINNTYEEGGAVYFRCNADNATLFVHQSIFIGNTANQNGGAMYIQVDGLHSNIFISESSFTQNSANSCGALSITKYYDDNEVQISDSTFNYNRAMRVTSMGGGAVCIMNTSAFIYNSTFIGNTAVGFGGAMVSHDSMVVINHTLFCNNSAGCDGGALIIYAHPSNYTIIQSIFTHNQAGDDGGALFIGHRGSYVTLETCTFINNYAIDRGGAITIFGSTIEITETTIDDNRAALGETFSSCNSNVMTSLYGNRDINCSYDDSITDHFNTTTPLKCQAFTNTTLSVMIGDFCTECQPSEPTAKEINKVAMAAYASLTISAIIIIAFLMYLSIEKLVRSKIKCMKGATALTPSTQPQHEPLYAEATVQANDNAEMIVK